MKTLKRIGIGLSIVALLLVLAVIFVPTQLSVDVSKTIDAKPSTLFNIVNDITLEDQWNPWKEQDTSMVNTYGDITKGLGASYSWESADMGNGSAKYTEVIKNEKIVSALAFDGMGGGEAVYHFTPADKGTTARWTLDSKTSRPWNVMNFFIKGNVKKSYNKGLENLEKLAQARGKQGLYRGYQVREETIAGRTYVIQRAVVPFAKATQYYSQNLGPLFQKIQAAGVVMDGYNSALVYNHDGENGTLDMAAAVPISQDVDIKDSASETIATRKGLVVDYYGDISTTEPAHMAIDEYMADRQMTFDWPIIEEYVTDPSKEPNPEKWLTRVIYLVGE